MQPEAQTTTRGSLADSVGALEIEIFVQGALEVLSFCLFYTVTMASRRQAGLNRPQLAIMLSIRFVCKIFVAVLNKEIF